MLRLPLNPGNLNAALIASMFYVFAATPLMFETTTGMGIGIAAATSWYVITFLTASIGSIVLSLRYRIPIAIGWSAPGLMFIAASRGRYSLAEIMGAVMIVGAVMVAMSLTGASDRLGRMLPIEVVMGVFAGSILSYFVSSLGEFAASPLTVVAAIAGYLVVNRSSMRWLPPVAGSVLFGMVAAVFLGGIESDGFQATGPSLDMVNPQFDVRSLIGIAIPLFVLTVATGNLPGFLVLEHAGFQVPVRNISIWLGLITIINGAFGGHSASIQSNGTIVMAGESAGPSGHRFAGPVLGGTLGIALVVVGASLFTALALIPHGLVLMLAALAMFSSMVAAVRKASAGPYRCAGLSALVVAMLPLSIAGIGATMWSLVVGLGVAWLTSRNLSETTTVAAMTPTISQT